MKLTNEQIYNYSIALQSTLDNSIYIPAKANFFICKNMEVLAAAAKEIENSRLQVAQHYGELTEDGTQYRIPQDKLEAANKELLEVFSIEQDLDIKTFSIDDSKNIELSGAQMQALLFMIEG